MSNWLGSLLHAFAGTGGQPPQFGPRNGAPVPYGSGSAPWQTSSSVGFGGPSPFPGTPGFQEPTVTRNGQPASITDLISGGVDKIFGPADSAAPGPGGGGIGDEASGARGGGMPDAPSGGWLSNLGGYIGNHPSAIGSGLMGLGYLSSMGSENALRRAEAQQAGTQAQASQYQLQVEKSRNAALDPVRRALMGQMQSRIGSPRPIAPNPYGVR